MSTPWNMFGGSLWSVRVQGLGFRIFCSPDTPGPNAVATSMDASILFEYTEMKNLFGGSRTQRSFLGVVPTLEVYDFGM